MKILARHISNLLFEHDCVIVPGLGGFITNYKPATIHPHHHTFYPPSKQVTFNAALNGNDGILINAMASESGIDFNEAKKMVDKMVHSIRISLLKGQKVEFDEIGYLVSNKENSIEFHPYNTVNYLTDAYGLQKFSFHPIDRSESSLVNKPAVRQTMRWAAIVTPIAAVALWATLNTGTVSRIYDSYASFFPSSVETTPAKAPVKKTASFTSPVASQPKQEERKVSVDAKNEANASKQQEVTPEVTAEKNDVNDLPVNNFHIIAGAFSIPENAVKLVDQLKKEGYNASVIGPNRRNLHMVSMEGFASKEAAEIRMAELHLNGYSSVWLFEKK